MGVAGRENSRSSPQDERRLSEMPGLETTLQIMKRNLPKKSTATQRKRVLIVDDHPFMRGGLARSINSDAGLCVCGEEESAEQALLAVEKLHPDIVVTDISLPGKSGLELIKDLASGHPSLPVLALSMHDESIYAERCLRAGARGYVMKSEDSENLLEAIRHVLGGGTYTSEETTARIVEAFSGRRDSQTQTPLGKLTDREFELFQLIGHGFSTHEIAERMQISAKTVETHRLNIKTKLKIASAVKLTAFAGRWVGSEK